MKNITVVHQEPGQLAQIKVVSNTLEAFNKLVGGYLEAIPLPIELRKLGVHAYVNEEGKLLRLPLNKKLDYISSVLVGPWFFSKTDEEGEDIGLTPKEAELVRQLVDKIPNV